MPGGLTAQVQLHDAGGQDRTAPVDFVNNAVAGTSGTIELRANFPNQDLSLVKNTSLGRGSASINTGGEKVFVDEVELVLRKHASVADCVVVGVPDTRFGERIVALVQVTDGDALDETELSAWCRTKLAGYKTPRRFLFVDAIDRSAAGKAAHARMRELAIERLSQSDA